MPSLLLALLLACSPATPDPKQPGAPQAKAQDARAKAAKAKAAKAKAAKAKAAKARAGAGGAGSGGGAKKIGAAGPMVGELVLTTQGEGEAMKTRAQLRTQWEGGQHTALLGITSGSCTQVEPREVSEGVTATWWAECQWKDMKADYAVAVTGGMVVVQRAISKDEKTGEWITVRRVLLADGAELVAGKVDAPAPEAPAGEGEATEEAGPAAPASGEGEAATPAKAPANPE